MAVCLMLQAGLEVRLCIPVCTFLSGLLASDASKVRCGTVCLHVRIRISPVADGVHVKHVRTSYLLSAQVPAAPRRRAVAANTTLPAMTLTLPHMPCQCHGHELDPSCARSLRDHESGCGSGNAYSRLHAQRSASRPKTSSSARVLSIPVLLWPMHPAGGRDSVQRNLGGGTDISVYCWRGH